MTAMHALCKCKNYVTNIAGVKNLSNAEVGCFLFIFLIVFL